MSIADAQRISFASDNSTGAHPDVLQAVIDANNGCVMAYGGDPYTEQARALFQRELGADAEPFFVFTGTGANVIALEAITRPHEAIICTDISHIYGGECGAPEKLTGCKLMGMAAPDGKLATAAVAAVFDDHFPVHTNRPSAVSVTQLTERGTAYSLAELQALSALAHERGALVHLDGARIANAAVHLDCSLAELTRGCGIDIVSFGGTKNGLLAGEAVVCFDPAVAERLGYIRKQSLNLASKMRFLSAQFIALLEDGLWRRCASHANQMAGRLRAALDPLPGVELQAAVDGNILLVEMPAACAHALTEQFDIYVRGENGDRALVRLVCSFRTTDDEVDTFVQAATEQLNQPAA